jgi:hypothetical protein
MTTETTLTKSWALRLPMNLKLRDLDGCTLDSDEKCLVVQGIPYQLMAITTGPLSSAAAAVHVLEPKLSTTSDSGGGEEEEDGPMLMEDDDDEDEPSTNQTKTKDDEKRANESPKAKQKQTKKSNDKVTTKPTTTTTTKPTKKIIRLVVKPTENYSLVETTLDASDAMLKTTTIDTRDTVLRKAYRHIPQVAGLKRRWIPLGSNIRDWKPRPVLLSNDDDATTPGTVPFLDEPLEIKPEVKDEPESEAIPPSRKRDRSDMKKSKKDHHGKKSKRKRTE